MSDHRLYILMRKDMASMNPGKACAQASHAANAFVHEIPKNKRELYKAYLQWSESTCQGFGTAIVLECDEVTLSAIIMAAQENDLPANRVLDPSYPLRDGDTVHHISIYTCGYVFVPENLRNQIPSLMSDLKLMK